MVKYMEARASRQGGQIEDQGLHSVKSTPKETERGDSLLSRTNGSKDDPH